MNILMIAPQPFFEPRGTPISVYQRIAGLSKLGHKVDLVTYSIGSDAEFPGVRIYRTAKLPFIRELKVGPSWPKVPLDILLFFRALGMLLRNRYDVIHSHEEAGILSMPLAAIFRTRHLYDMHSSLPNQLVNFNFGNNRPTLGLFRWLEKRVINSCDAMITIGPDLEQHAKSINSSVPHQMIENLPMLNKLTESEVQRLGQLRAQFGCDQKLVIVYAGTFERYQGVDLLLESASVVCRQHPNVQFFLVGGKPDQVTSQKQQADGYGLEEQVIFTGTLPVEEANLYLQLADILVSPRVDGTSVPLKIYTYLQMGKPIMATDLPAHNLVLDEEHAVLVKPDLDSFVDGLNRLIADKSLRERLGKAGLDLAEEKYSLATYLAKLEKIYQTLEVPARQVQTPVKQAQAKD